jgi:signal transduction histidine kinase
VALVPELRTGQSLTPIAVGLNLASLGLLVWGAVTEARPGTAGAHLAALVLLVAFAPLGLVFVGVAALAATIGWPVPWAATIAAGGCAAARNHLARELHDVLAHTLAALSLQLEALDTVVSADPAVTPEVRLQHARTRQLVREGVDEAHGAVRALRDDALPLESQLERLAAAHQATLTLGGTARPLPPRVSASLYRVAREAVTNALKHAPGAPVRIHVDFGRDLGTERVRVTVENGAPARPEAPARRVATVASDGGGYGLQGIRERIALLGGRVEAGAAGEGWRVEAEVPA